MEADRTGRKIQRVCAERDKPEYPGGNQMFGELGLDKHFVDPVPVLKGAKRILA